MPNNEPNNDSTTSTRPRRRTDCMTLPFNTHPLYQLRRIIVILAILCGCLCMSATTSGYYYDGALVHSSVLLCLSAFLCLLDLICWGIRKKDHPDEEPARPTGKWALMDLLAAIALQLAFWATLPNLTYPYRYDGLDVVAAYGILGALICSILHFWCFWKQLMDSKKKAWLATLQHPACARCGYLEEQSSPTTTGDQRPREEQPNVFPYAGPSAAFGRSNVVTPESPESAMEEGLLIGSDFGSNYGSVERDEPVLESPEDIVVGKGKKKAKSSGSQKGSTKASPS